MSPEFLRDLQQSLPPFGPEAVPCASMHTFCDFYGIDFVREATELEHRVGYVDSGEFRLAVHCWQQPGAVANLLIVHGYYDHTGLFSKLIEWGIGQHCNVISFDLPGHGLSTGEPAVIHDFTDYAQAVHSVLSAVELPELPLWGLGQSTGCAALMTYARSFAWPFSASVFLAPLVRPASWSSVRLAHRLLNRFVRAIPRKFSVNSSDEAFLAFQQRDPLQCREVPLAWVKALANWLSVLPRKDLGVGPVLVVQGDCDGTVDWRYNVPYVADLFPGTEVFYLEGAGHQLANESLSLRQTYLARVAAYFSASDVASGQASSE